ncbi:MAG: hypothetical protein AUJ57_06215 [Zetaproteobacteria bacterium CG1_02_53_45]|nr:MAG: hypothetical protein AUJ57_06215 [Zetaproteobacteria bacterium CG1_02_53_45]
MILTATICLGLAIYSFSNGLVLAGLLTLVGIIPGPGMIPLLGASVLFVINEQPVAAIVPLFIIGFNVLRATSALSRPS